MTRRTRTPPNKFGLLKAMLADANLSASAKVIGTVLLIHFHNSKTGRCNPSFRAIGEAAGRTRRAVFPAVEELHSAGWLVIEGTKGGAPGSTNSFAFNFKRVKQTSPVTGAADDTPTGEAYDTGEAERRDGCSTLHPNREEPLSPSERECVGLASALAPGGAALAEQFDQLCLIWRKPHGVNRKLAWKAFENVCQQHDGAEVIVSAERWVAATPERYLKKLEDWLGNGAWRNDPPSRQGGARGTKSNPVEEMLKAGGLSRGAA